MRRQPLDCIVIGHRTNDGKFVPELPRKPRVGDYILTKAGFNNVWQIQFIAGNYGNKLSLPVYGVSIWRQIRVASEYLERFGFSAYSLIPREPEPVEDSDPYGMLAAVGRC